MTDADEQPPVLTIMNAQNEAIDTLFISAGENLDVTLDITDNTGISSTRVFMQKLTENIAYPCTRKDAFSLLLIDSWEVQNINYTLDELLPDSISGIYRLNAQAYDEEGNLGSDLITILVNNPELVTIDSVLLNSGVVGCSFAVPQETIELAVYGQSESELSSIQLVFTEEGQELWSETRITSGTQLLESFTVSSDISEAAELTLIIQSLAGVKTYVDFNLPE